MNQINSNIEASKHINHKGFLIDLIIYISVMFLVRELYIPKVGFIANGLFWSFTTLIEGKRYYLERFRVTQAKKLWKNFRYFGYNSRSRNDIINKL